MNESKEINSLKDVNIGDNHAKTYRKRWLWVSGMVLITCIGVLGYLTQGLFIKQSIHEAYQIKDQGAIAAIQANFIQDINISSEHNDLIFTVDHLIVDEKRLLLLYTVKSHREEGHLTDIRYTIQDGSGERLPLCLMNPDIDMDLAKQKEYKGTMNFIFSESEIPDNIQLDLRLNTEEYSSVKSNESATKSKGEEIYEWHVSIPIDQEPFQDKKIVYDLQKCITIGQQKIYIDGVIIYPTITVVNMRHDGNNSKEIFEMIDFKIKDGDREYSQGVSSFISTYGDGFSVYYESNYFDTDNKQLSLIGNGIRALTKDKLNIMVNLDNETIETSLEDIELKEVRQDYIVFAYKKDRFQLSMTFLDGTGKEQETNRQGYTSGDDGCELIYYLPEGIQIVNPLTFKITGYSEIVEQPFEIKILE